MIIYFFISFLLSALLTVLMMRAAFRLGILDRPGPARKVHKADTPLLGGAAIFLAFAITSFLARQQLLAGRLEIHHWMGVFAGGLFLIVGGILDDKYDLKPSRQFIFPVLAVASVIIGGVQIEKITNPFGGFIYLKAFSGVLIALWLLGMMYTTKLLDGLDGLVSGVTAIGSFIIFLFTLTTRYYQPDIALAALIFSAACLGFLVFNWHPAKIFLGEGGSLLLGFVLGVLAIISGGKIAIALLIMGIPILDVVWTILRRLAAGKNPFKFADRKHLHFRLFDSGLGARKTVLVFYLFSAVFGLAGLFLQSQGKLLALGALILIMLVIVIIFSRIEREGN